MLCHSRFVQSRFKLSRLKQFSLKQCLRLLALLLCGFAGALPAADDHAVILLYHHVSASTPPSTSVTPDQFRQHLDYLHSNGYQVLALDDLLDRLMAGKTVPENSVVITFDDAYESIYSQAAPLLEELGWPYTVFLASEPLDNKTRGYLSWQQARELRGRGASFAPHSVTHAYLARRQKEESEAAWQRRISWEIDENRARLKAELGAAGNSFAYPFGEYNAAMKALLQARKLYGLAQQSGAVGHHTDPRQIPRFPMATGYADMERFKVAINSRPLPVLEETLAAPGAASSGSVLTLRLAAGDYREQGLGCFTAAGEPLQLVAQAALTYQLQLPPSQPGRNKINCTAPALSGRSEFFWHSYLWLDY
ncbi:polysaccharide deacetylase family protein [Pseudomaricurvus alcaniphilus]|uniref:polysaccharide deacetylase family protein n=1 Tax=Pseudomaricurvus alcaniphilus TaxID=1166482 RepID=UPI0014076304|nr:polysaccharide deacetylase family protein [Pseudomaricurvus alcaniphilus]NHN38660.1 polysaccharide deacetylase family protein [Pseudomaricurvus alcaniphilus]